MNFPLCMLFANRMRKQILILMRKASFQLRPDPQPQKEQKSSAWIFIFNQLKFFFKYQTPDNSQDNSQIIHR